jgi:hypothetical protein
VLYAQPREVTHVLLSGSDVTAYSAFLKKFGFRAAEKGSESADPDSLIVRLNDGQIELAVMKNTLLKDNFIGTSLAMFTDSIESIAAWLKELDYNPEVIMADGSVKEVDVMAPGNIRLFIHPAKKIVYPADIPNPICGTLLEFTTDVPDIEKAFLFWQKFGYRPTLKGEKPYPYCILHHENNFSIGLHVVDHPEPPSLAYGAFDAKQKVAAIRRGGTEPIIVNMDEKGETDNAMFQAPEGLVINIYTIKK